MKAFKELTYKSPETVLNKVYDDNFPWWKQYVRHNSGNTQDAQDVFQEAVCAAWLNLKEGRFEGHQEQFNAYVRQICKHKWMNHLKSSARKKMQLEHDFSAYGNHTDNEAIDAQWRESKLLQHCFSQIGRKCRQVLGLFYYKRQPLAIIAEQTGDTEESIKTIKYRCMKKLRALYIEKYEQDE